MRKKSKENVMLSVANLDENNIYQGVIFISATELMPGHVQVPTDCDLAPDCYEWIEAQQTFMPTAGYIKQQMKGT